MTCKEAVRKLYEYLDRELDNAAEDQIKKHLDFCRLCCDHFEFEKEMKEIIHNTCLKEKAPGLLKEKIESILK